MKKLLNWGIFYVLLCLIPLGVNAQVRLAAGKVYTAGVPVNATTAITWPFNLGTAGQVATFTAGTEGYFGSNWVDNGSNLNYKDKTTTYSITYTRFYPTVQNNSVTANDNVGFSVRPKTGLSFTPTSVSFDCQRYGTDGGSIDVIWKSADGATTTIATALKPARDNSGAGTHASYDLASLSVPASSGDCGLYIYIYGLGTTKSIGLANVVINGTVQGTLVDVVTHTFATSVYPAGAGSISANPVGNELDEGTQITLKANRNFGFQFKEWRDANADTILSISNPYTVTLNSNMAVKAVYDSIKTYSLTVNAQGAPGYMISVAPAGTSVNGQTMYETGTTVTLTASNNHILTFTNWLTGETNSTFAVPMTQNQNITGVFSAVDYIVGWDFYKSGASSRPADFYSTPDNQTATLILRKADGTVSSWLDKSIASAGGYSNRGAAVNWQPIANQLYYQASFNATDFTDIKVSAGMLYNYNAYSVQKCEYSLDGTTFTTLGTYTLSAASTWFDNTFALPAECNHANKVYVRWIPDYTSTVAGSAATNDGTALSSVYITAKTVIYNDGVAPVFVSSVPAASAVNASTTGKVVLTFDEKVMLTSGSVVATLAGKTITPAVSGKTITFPYTGLDYNTAYNFTLPANSLADLAGNTLTSPVSISFTTMTRPTVAKKAFDFVVGVDGDFKAAIAAAAAVSSSGERFRIFFPNGQYNIGANTGDANQMTTISIPNLSIIGQSGDNVVVYNKSIQESINSTATMYFTSTSSSNYIQDISLMNKMDYRILPLVGRGVALWDQGNKNIYKNVKLLSNQDTYFTGGAIRSYLENCEIHGTVDYICGGGDIFFNECLLYMEERSGNVIAAPATNTTWGYVFSNCTIDGFAINNGSYRLGRPWQNSPKAVYLNTTMNILPTADGWTEMGVVPGLFADYNSVTSSGTLVDLSARKKVYTYNGVSTTVNPYITAEQAATYTIENVLGGTDSWQPKLYTDQAAVPVIAGNGTSISWADNNYVLCWAVFKDDVFVKFVTTNSYTVPSTVTSGNYTVRAANEMGGLSAASNAYAYTSANGIYNPNGQSELIEQTYYTFDGRKIRRLEGYKGTVIVRSVYADGRVETSKIIKLFY